MKAVYFMVLLLLIASCASQVETKNSENANNNAQIRTTRAEISNEIVEQKIISFNIISPHDGQIIDGSTAVVKLEAGNFSIVPVGSPVKKNEGHFHVWLDSVKKVTTNPVTTFENVSSGKHTIVAELVKSDHSSLSPKIIRTVTINIINGFVQKQPELQPGEFNVEVDDHGFYPNAIQANVGDKIKINFKFRDDSIYFAGLDVKGPFPTIQYKLHGKQPLTAEFTVDGPAKIDSYWPSTGVHKATLNVEIGK